MTSTGLPPAWSFTLSSRAHLIIQAARADIEICILELDMLFDCKIHPCLVFLSLMMVRFLPVAHKSRNTWNGVAYIHVFFLKISDEC